MRVGKVFSHVCVSVCVCVCVFVYLCVCLSVQAVTFEALHIETSYLECRYIFTISRSNLSIKVIRSRSSSYEKNNNFTYVNMLVLFIWLQVINKVKVTRQGEGHIRAKVKYLHPFKFYVAHALCVLVKNNTLRPPLLSSICQIEILSSFLPISTANFSLSKKL